MLESEKKLAAVARLGEVVIAFDAEHVVGVEADTPDREMLIELPELFELERSGEHPRVVAFGEGAGNVAVKLGESVWFEEYQPGTVRPIPVFLSGMESANAVVGVLEREEEMVLLLDIEWLRAIDRRGSV